MGKNGKQAVLLLTLVFFCGIFRGQLFRHARLMNLSGNLRESSVFREMEFSPEALVSLDALMEDGYEPGRLLSVLLPWRDFHLPPKTVWDRETYLKAAEAFQTYRPLELKDFQNALSAVWDDLEEFPVSCEPTYEDSWLFERSFGGERHHEGCDLMPPENRRDFYPVRSMTDGVVEKIGWLTLGGWRIGIRSFRGGYFYYAHLSSYARDFQEGDLVSAGDLLGYMGDSGYGPEGTTEKFDVHLHVGIYIEGKNQEEISVNPYWPLRYLEETGKE
ncbi:MAG: M23 family metallopeptidase [Lachnospiraceae bacterium]